MTRSKRPSLKALYQFLTDDPVAPAGANHLIAPDYTNHKPAGPKYVAMKEPAL